MKISDFLFDRRSCLWFCRTNEFSSGAPILACWHICCSAQNLPPTRYNTQPSHPTVYTRHPLCIPFGSDYGVSYTYAPSSIIQLLFHKSRTIQRGANQDEYIFFRFRAPLGKCSPPSSAKSIQQKPALLTCDMDIEKPLCWNDVQEVLCELFQFAKESSSAVEWSKCQSKSKSSLRLL